MIERRRMASPAGPSMTEPSESGPRWTSVSFIAASAAGSGAVAPSRLTRPHIPHMAASLESGQARTCKCSLRVGPELSRALQLAPAPGPVVRHDLLEHCFERRRVDRFILAKGDSTSGFVLVPAGDDPLRIGNDRAVIQEDVDVILCRQQGADVALEHEVGTVPELDGLNHARVGSMDKLPNLTADRLLPARQRVNVGVNPGVGHVGDG